MGDVPRGRVRRRPSGTTQLRRMSGVPRGGRHPLVLAFRGFRDRGLQRRPVALDGTTTKDHSACCRRSGDGERCSGHGLKTVPARESAADHGAAGCKQEDAGDETGASPVGGQPRVDVLIHTFTLTCNGRVPPGSRLPSIAVRDTGSDPGHTEMSRPRWRPGGARTARECPDSSPSPSGAASLAGATSDLGCGREFRCSE